MKHRMLVFLSAGLTLFSLGILVNPWNFVVALVFGAMLYIGVEVTSKEDGDEAINNNASRFALIGVIAVSFMVVPWFDWTGAWSGLLALISIAFASLSLWAVTPDRKLKPS